MLAIPLAGMGTYYGKVTYKEMVGGSCDTRALLGRAPILSMIILTTIYLANQPIVPNEFHATSGPTTRSCLVGHLRSVSHRLEYKCDSIFITNPML